MKKSHRTILAELCSICNILGASLDRTSTHEKKLWDRQQGHMLVSHVLYGILVDDPENESKKEDMRKALESLKSLEQLTKKTYTDRVGFLKPEEKSAFLNQLTFNDETPEEGKGGDHE